MAKWRKWYNKILSFGCQNGANAACVCFNAITGSVPSYLSDLLHLYTPSRILRSPSDTRLFRIQRYKRKTHGFRSFSQFLVHTSGILSLVISGTAQLFHHLKHISKSTFPRSILLESIVNSFPSGTNH